MLDLYNILIEHGLWAAVVGILLMAVVGFVLRDQQRLRALELRIQELETDNRKQALSMLSRCETALNRVADVMVQNQKILEKILLEK